jgi:hypothetical protein
LPEGNTNEVQPQSWNTDVAISHPLRPRISVSKDGDRTVACFLHRGYIDDESPKDSAEGVSGNRVVRVRHQMPAYQA